MSVSGISLRTNSEKNIMELKKIVRTDLKVDKLTQDTVLLASGIFFYVIFVKISSNWLNLLKIGQNSQFWCCAKKY